ncbi:hypothetical protein HOLleu_22931 [Holothuria leucospilota]|uniref:Arylamine N-acetyltransferase n=1 Tax=Holothuria leucospilota TaxID=206669 RepID=A0A9Q1H2J6_HOLLE|nr:hypothetical protein HOLleu_22931 [Holothuria leucospilota]
MLKEAVSYNLTKEEALCFVEKVLDIPTPENLIHANKEYFIREFVRQVNLNIPFTNVPFITNKGLTTLSLNECKEAMFTRQGGNCVIISSFVKAVIELLGIDCYTIGGSLYRWKNPVFEDHLAVIVQNVTFPGSLHLLDLGTRYFFEPVPLDFDRVSPVYQCRHFPYRFFHVSAGVVQLCRKYKLSKKGPNHLRLIYVENDEWWEVLTTFRTLQPKCLLNGLELNRLIAEDRNLTSLSGSDILLFGYPNGLSVDITTKRCLTMSENGLTEMVKMTSPRNVIETVQKYFPQYSYLQVEAVVNHFSSR